MGTRSAIVSVVVPIHNAAEFLQSTVNCILAQTLRDIEVILVDDRSTDGSLKLCQEIAARDRRVIALSNNSDNHGVAATRNVGIDHATGQYLAFVDHDDRIDPEMYRVMSEVAEELKVDFVDCSYQTRTVDGRISTSRNSHPKRVHLDRQYLIGACVPPLVGTLNTPGLFIGNVVWNKIFRVDLIRKHNIRFNDSRMKFEDRLFVVEFLYFADSGAFLDNAFYTWTRRKGSLLSRYNPEEARAVINNQLRYRELFGELYNFDSSVAVDYRMNAVLDVVWSIVTREDPSARKTKIVELVTDPSVREWAGYWAPTPKAPALMLARESILRGRATQTYVALLVHLMPRYLPHLAVRMARGARDRLARLRGSQ